MVGLMKYYSAAPFYVKHVPSFCEIRLEPFLPEYYKCIFLSERASALLSRNLQLAGTTQATNCLVDSQPYKHRAIVENLTINAINFNTFEYLP